LSAGLGFAADFGFPTDFEEDGAEEADAGGWMFSFFAYGAKTSGSCTSFLGWAGGFFSCAAEDATLAAFTGFAKFGTPSAFPTPPGLTSGTGEEIFGRTLTFFGR
jgi:hypothetical protein